MHQELQHAASVEQKVAAGKRARQLPADSTDHAEQEVDAADPEAEAGDQTDREAASSGELEHLEQQAASFEERRLLQVAADRG